MPILLTHLTPPRCSRVSSASTSMPWSSVGTSTVRKWFCACVCRSIWGLGGPKWRESIADLYYSLGRIKYVARRLMPTSTHLIDAGLQQEVAQQADLAQTYHSHNRKDHLVDNGLQQEVGGALHQDYVTG